MGAVTIERKLSIEEREAQQRDRDLGHVLSSPQGRRVLWRFMAESGMDLSSYLSANGDAMRMAFLEGQRANGIRIRDVIAAVDASSLITMQVEEIASQKRLRDERAAIVMDEDAAPQ